MEVRIKGCISKAILATMYVRPRVTGAMVSTPQSFGRMIHSRPDLMAKLATVGYKKWQKILTPKQAQVIVDEFGYPANDTMPDLDNYIECYQPNPVK